MAKIKTAAYQGALSVAKIVARQHTRTPTLFIAGHARSGSTLLTHLLANHPDIAGYGETHITYRSAASLNQLRADVLLHRPKFFVRRPHFFMDKVLKKGLLHPDQVCLLQADRDRAIILVREPVATYWSMNGGSFQFPHDRIKATYNHRMNWLGDLARRLAAFNVPAIWLTYADLTEETPACLESLTSFLGLRSPIKPTYRTFRTTRLPCVGDRSQKIFAGKIDARPRSEAKPIPGDAAQEMTAAFENCLACLGGLLPRANRTAAAAP